MSDPLANLLENNPAFKAVVKGLTCRTPGCPLVAVNRPYCDNHRCVQYGGGCPNPKKWGSLFCEWHACLTCGGTALSGKKYCREHNK
jgi:hypothetical protein